MKDTAILDLSTGIVYLFTMPAFNDAEEIIMYLQEKEGLQLDLMSVFVMQEPDIKILDKR